MNALLIGNCWIRQSANSSFDHPKMPEFSKKSNFLKDLEAVAKNHTIKAYYCFCLDDEDSFIKLKDLEYHGILQ